MTISKTRKKSSLKKEDFSLLASRKASKKASQIKISSFERKTTSETRFLLDQLLLNNFVLEKYGLTEDYVTKVLGLPKPLLTEGRISETAFRKIIREHLIFESWWDSAKDLVGSGVNAVKEKGESVAGVLKKYGGDSKAVVAALWSAASSPQDLTILLTKFKSAVSSTSSEISSFLENISNYVSNSNKLEEILASSLKKCIEFVKKAAASVASLAGWKGMMSSAGAYLGFEWITEKIRPFKEKVKEALKSESVELAKSVIKDEVVDFINSKLTDVVKKFSGSIIEQLSGPTGWLKTAYEIFEKSSWVLGKLSAVISTSTEEFPEDKIA